MVMRHYVFNRCYDVLNFLSEIKLVEFRDEIFNEIYCFMELLNDKFVQIVIHYYQYNEQRFPVLSSMMKFEV